jgi:hypothetical protein
MILAMVQGHQYGLQILETGGALEFINNQSLATVLSTNTSATAQIIHTNVIVRFVPPRHVPNVQEKNVIFALQQPATHAIAILVLLLDVTVDMDVTNMGLLDTLFVEPLTAQDGVQIMDVLVMGAGALVVRNIGLANVNAGVSPHTGNAAA